LDKLFKIRESVEVSHAEWFHFDGGGFFVNVLVHVFKGVRFLARKMANFLGNKNVKMNTIVVCF
jgi:hypothetical protein